MTPQRPVVDWTDERRGGMPPNESTNRRLRADFFQRGLIWMCSCPVDECGGTDADTERPS